MRSPQRILVPFDVSVHSTTAVDYAGVLAGALGGSVRLLYVYEPLTAMADVVPGPDVEEEAVATREIATHELAGMEARVRAQGCEAVDSVIALGAPIEEILRYAAGFDLIVMGTHCRTRLSRLLLGSVTEQVMRRTPVPVLVVHLPPEERT